MSIINDSQENGDQRVAEEQEQEQKEGRDGRHAADLLVAVPLEQQESYRGHDSRKVQEQHRQSASHVVPRLEQDLGVQDRRHVVEEAENQAAHDKLDGAEACPRLHGSLSLTVDIASTVFHSHIARSSVFLAHLDFLLVFSDR